MTSSSHRAAKHASDGGGTAGDGRSDASRSSEPTTDSEKRRLELLFLVSRILTRFESVKRDVSAVLGLMAEVVPLRTAVLVLDEGGAPALACLWFAAGTSAERQETAIAFAREAYPKLAGQVVSAQVDVDTTEPAVLRGARSDGEAEHAAFVLLPLVVSGGAIFGALEVEGAVPLDERDLAFINTVVNQLALAIDRQRAVEARRAEAEARRAEAERGRAHAEALQHRYEALVDNLDRAFVWESSAPDRRLNYVSARAAELLGIDQWKGRDLLDRVHPADRAVMESALTTVLSERKDRSVEHRMVAHDGSVRWFHTGVHLADTEGRACWQGVSIDVTDAHDAAERVALQLELNRAVTTSLGEGVLAVNQDLCVTFLNPAAEAMLRRRTAGRAHRPDPPDHA